MLLLTLSKKLVGSYLAFNKVCLLLISLERYINDDDFLMFCFMDECMYNYL